MSAIRNFIMGRIFPTILIPLYMVVIYVFDWIFPNNLISPIIIVVGLLALIIWIVLRGWVIQNKLDLINEYNLLTSLLETLDDTMSPDSIKSLVLSLKTPVSPFYKDHFDKCGDYLNEEYIDLNKSLKEIIHNPYRLLIGKALTDNRNKFKRLVIKNYNIYNEFIVMLDDKKISKSLFDFAKLNYLYTNFFYSLNMSGNKSNPNLKEIRQDFPSNAELFKPLPEPKQ